MWLGRVSLGILSVWFPLQLACFFYGFKNRFQLLLWKAVFIRTSSALLNFTMRFSGGSLCCFFRNVIISCANAGDFVS